MDDLEEFRATYGEGYDDAIYDVEKIIDNYYPTWVNGHGELKRSSEEFLKLIQNELKQQIKSLKQRE